MLFSKWYLLFSQSWVHNLHIRPFGRTFLTMLGSERLCLYFHNLPYRTGRLKYDFVPEFGPCYKIFGILLCNQFLLHNVMADPAWYGVWSHGSPLLCRRTSKQDSFPTANPQLLWPLVELGRTFISYFSVTWSRHRSACRERGCVGTGTRLSPSYQCQ